MSGGGGSKNTTTTQTQDPWEGAQPYLLDALKHAQGRFNANQLQPPVYGGDRVANMPSAGHRGLDMMFEQAGGRQPVIAGATGVTSNALKAASPIYGQAGRTAKQGLKSVSGSFSDPAGYADQFGDIGRGQHAQNIGALGPLQGQASGAARAGLGNVAQSFADPSRYQDRFGDIGRNQYAQNIGALGDNRRSLDAVKARALGSAIPSASSAFTGSGILDSSMAMDTVGQAAMDAVAPIEYGAHADMMNRNMAMMGQAQDQAFGAGQAGLDRGMQLGSDVLNRNANMLGQAQGQSFAAGQAGLDRGMQLGSDMMMQGQRATALAPSTAALGYMPGQQMMGVGQVQQAQRQAEIDAAMARHFEQGNVRNDELARYSNLILGYGGLGGQSSGTQSGGGPSRGAGALGGVASGAAIGSMFGPWGTGIGAGIGGLAGLFL